jgi:broad specificity phosphatase PhoE
VARRGPYDGSWPRAEDVVLVGHGTAWTLLVSELSGEPPDLERWARLAMPDVWVVDHA